MADDIRSTIDGIGMMRAYKLMKIYGSIENILVNIRNNNIDGRTNVPAYFGTKYIIAPEYFINPPVYTQDEFGEIKWSEPKLEELTNLLVTKYSYDREIINENILPQLYGGHYRNIMGKNGMQVYTDRELSRYTARGKYATQNEWAGSRNEPGARENQLIITSKNSRYTGTGDFIDSDEDDDQQLISQVLVDATSNIKFLTARAAIATEIVEGVIVG